MGWSLVARIDRVRESQFEDANEAYIGAHGESTETAPLRFFWRMHDASEDRGYHVESQTRLWRWILVIKESTSLGRGKSEYWFCDPNWKSQARPSRKHD